MILILFTGCFSTPKFQRKDLNVTEKNKSHISGTITPNKKSDKPYYLVLFKIYEDNYKLVDFSIHLDEKPFQFKVTTGNYFLYVCQDPQVLSDKTMGFEYYSDVITLTQNKNNVENINVKMSDESRLILNNKLINTTTEESVLERINYEKVTTLKDPIFDRKNAKKGLHNPRSFFAGVAGGVYMLEEYTPNKIPILFVHGMNGTPLDFETMIESIDREKYQPWVYYYPSGLNLNYAVSILKTSFDKLLKKNSVDKVVVVAHSMGGLVSRGFINVYNSKIEIPKFITISTPWNGSKFTALGAESIPGIAASFGNMIPGSAFQKKILNENFENNTQHFLFFGYKSSRSFILDNSNDGTISLSSQLFGKAQEQAHRVYGFNENHISILSDEKVLSQINKILDK